jgi:hypothetical protein
MFSTLQAWVISAAACFDHADGRLGTGERRLEIHVALRPVLVGPDGPNLRIAEDVTKDEGVDGTGRHRCDPFQKLVVPKGRDR